MRCHGNHQLFRMCHSKCQMPVHKRNQQTNVLYQVCKPPMSSPLLTEIRQVQDLQLQLADAKRTISQLESMIQTPRRPGSGSPPNHSARLSELANLAAKGRIIPLLGDFDSVRSSIQTCSRGIFKIPPLYRPFTPAVLIATSEVTLPAKDIADALLSQFYRYYNAHILFIDWPCFIAQIEKCYANGSVQGVSPVWASTFFVALACGTLQSVERDKPGMNPDKDGIQYLVVGSRLSNSWTDSLSINHARTSILISTFLQEQNLRSAGWSWLGGGVRMLDEIGLNLDSGVWSGQEGEFRRSVYWAIFSYDRCVHSSSSNDSWLTEQAPNSRWTSPHCL